MNCDRARFLRCRSIAMFVIFTTNLSGCSGPPTADDCFAYPQTEQGLDCMDGVTFGSAVKNATMGAIVGGAVGAGVGGLIGGPRGAIKGGLAGAGVGAVTGVIITYSDAVANLSADNRHLRDWIALYMQRDAETRAEIENLKAQLAATDRNSRQGDQIIARMQQKITSLNADVTGLQKRINLLNDELSKQKNYASTVENGLDYQSQINVLKENINSLEEFKRNAIYREAELNKEIDSYKAQSMGPTLPLRERPNS